MHTSEPSAIPFAAPPPAILLEEPIAWVLAVVVLLASGFFALLRDALRRSSPARVLEGIADERRRGRVAPLLERADSLATSASTLKTCCDLLFIALVLLEIVRMRGEAGTLELLIVVAIAVPPLLLVGEVLPAALAFSRGDPLLRRFLPTFAAVQVPVAALVYTMELARALVLRVFGIPERPRAARPIVESLRGVIEEAQLDRDLDEHQREIIENVVEFHAVDVAELMTPRTEMHAVEICTPLDEVVRELAASGHSRIPVYEGSLDTIVGWISARDVIQALANGRLDDCSLRDLLRPAYFVPETKLVSELLVEFRREKIKLAIVLDEYGGTAGIVTMGDLLSELVGELQDEFDADEPPPIQPVAEGVVEVSASLRIDEVNEELDLELPDEEDFETLGGFVLAELGHFPKRGESFVHGDAEFEVVDSNDRRVLRVRVRKLAAQSGG